MFAIIFCILICRKFDKHAQKWHFMKCGNFVINVNAILEALNSLQIEANVGKLDYISGFGSSLSSRSNWKWGLVVIERHQCMPLGNRSSWRCKHILPLFQCHAVSVVSDDNVTNSFIWANTIVIRYGHL